MAIRLVTVVPMLTSSSSVIGRGTEVNTGGISLRSSTFIRTRVVAPFSLLGFSRVPIMSVCWLSRSKSRPLVVNIVPDLGSILNNSVGP